MSSDSTLLHAFIMNTQCCTEDTDCAATEMQVMNVNHRTSDFHTETREINKVCIDVGQPRKLLIHKFLFLL